MLMMPPWGAHWKADKISEDCPDLIERLSELVHFVFGTYLGLVG